MSDDKNYREADVILADVCDRLTALGIGTADVFILGTLYREYGAARAATASMAMAKPMLYSIKNIADTLKDARDDDDEPWKSDSQAR